MAKIPQSNPINEGLRLLNHCPVCQGDLQANEKNIIVKKGETNLIHITCPRCQNSIMALTIVTSFGLSSVGMVTDLEAKDIIFLQGKGTITEDELLAFHQTLKNNRVF